jgi:hypothetical protein
LSKKFYNSLKIGQNYFLQYFKNKIIYNFVKFAATKNGIKTNFFQPSPLLLFLGSEIRDPGSGMGKNQDPGSGTNIPDPQHCILLTPNISCSVEFIIIPRAIWTKKMSIKSSIDLGSFSLGT